MEMLSVETGFDTIAEITLSSVVLPQRKAGDSDLEARRVLRRIDRVGVDLPEGDREGAVLGHDHVLAMGIDHVRDQRRAVDRVRPRLGRLERDLLALLVALSPSDPERSSSTRSSRVPTRNRERFAASLRCWSY